MTIPTCPICHLPAHAAESDDFDRHEACAARFYVGPVNALDLAMIGVDLGPRPHMFRRLGTFRH